MNVLFVLLNIGLGGLGLSHFFFFCVFGEKTFFLKTPKVLTLLTLKGIIN